MASISGTTGSDSFFGTAGSDLLFGLDGSDAINGLGDADSLYGGQGDDTLTGGDGNDLIYDSDSGNVDVASDNDILYGGAGDDQLFSSQGLHFQDRDTLFGGSGNDFLFLGGAQTNDSVDGGTGTDTLDLRLDATTFQAVVANFNLAGFVVQLNGVNTVFAANVERVVFSSGGGNDQLSGGGLDDFLISYGGTDTLKGNGGNDIIAVRLENASDWTAPVDLDGGTGIDILEWSVRRGISDAHVFSVPGGFYTRAGVSVGTIRSFEVLNVTGGNGADNFTGGSFSDTLFGAAGNDLLDGGSGTDVLSGGDGADTLFGGAGNDSLRAENFAFVQSANSLYGGEGDDYLAGGTAIDTLDGGTGNDTYEVSTGDVLIDSGGIDQIRYSASAGTLDLGLFASIENVLLTQGFSAIVLGNALDNTIETNGISATVNAGAGADRLVGGRANEVFRGEAGSDTLSGGVFFDTLYGGDDADTVSGDENNDSVQGDAGDDLVLGGDGADTVSGGLGNDRVYGEALPVNPGNGTGSGVQAKAAGSGTLITSAVNLSNNFSLTANPDILAATLVPHVTVNATYNGGSGDWYRLDFTNPDVTVTVDIDRAALTGTFSTQILILNAAGQQVANSFPFLTRDLGGTGSVTDNDGFVSFRATTAGAWFIRVVDDTFGSRTSDSYQMHVSLGVSGGNDSLSGGEGNDTLFGGFENDTLDGGTGNDTLNGGQGVDWASYAGATAAVAVNLALTTAQATGGGGLDTLTGIENLLGSAFNDRLTGSAGDNTLAGGGGNDVLNGGAGFDTVSFAAAVAGVSLDLTAATQDTGEGVDRLISIEAVIGSTLADLIEGGTGADGLYAGAGNDTVAGRLGNDTLAGGAGVDVLRLSSATSGVVADLVSGLTSGGDGADRIAEFEALVGSAFGDRLSGDAGANTLAGGLGNDTLDGREGDDRLSGDAGNDRLIGGLGIDLADYGAALLAVTVDLAVLTGQATGGAGVDLLAGIENLTGGAGGDTLSGDAGANSLTGGAGNDTLSGRAGDDRLAGGAGNDSLAGGDGRDVADYAGSTLGITVDLSLLAAQNTGGAGVDRLSGIEVLIGSAFNDRLTGGAASETLEGGAGNDALAGGDGNDTLAGGAGNDVLNGGAGIDTASYAATTLGVTVDLAVVAGQNTGGAGIDRLALIENLTGGIAGDTLLGSDLGNRLQGGAGNDSLNGRGGNDTLEGGSDFGSDIIEGGAGIDTLSLAEAIGATAVDLSLTSFQSTGSMGFDLITGIENITGSGFGDGLRGNEAANLILGGLGDDTIEGRGGDDVLNGGLGSDQLSYASALAGVTLDLGLATAQNTGGAGTDRVAGFERLLGSSLADTLFGALVADTLDGGAGDDRIEGRAGDDLMLSGAGNDTFNGGDGLDRVLFTAFTGLTINLSLTTAQANGSLGSDTFLGIEEIVSTANGFADILTGNASDNFFDAYAGDDVLSGLGGNDRLVGSYGRNTLDGGAGFDWAEYLEIVPGVGNAGVTISLGVTGAQTVSGGSTDTLIDIEGLRGSRGHDRLTGTAGANGLTGEAGDDALTGGGGADTLRGGAGLDTLTGGAAADSFVFDVAPILAGSDVITDFTTGQDRLLLDRAAFTAFAAAGGLTPAAFTANATGRAADTFDRIIHDTATGRLLYDADGSLTGVAAIEFARIGTAAITVGDIFIL